MKIQLRKSIAAVSVVLAASFGLAACGNDDGDTNDTKSEQKSDEKTDKNSDSGEGSVDAGDLTKETFAAAMAKAQADAKGAKATMEAAGGAGSMTMEMNINADEPLKTELQAFQPGSSDPLLIMVDGIMYIDATQSGTYMKVDLTDESNPMGAMFSQVVSQTNPAASAAAFEKAATEFTKVGDGPEIDGVATTEYRIVLDTKKALEAQGLGDLAEAAGQAAPATTEATMFLGEDALPRRVVSSAAGQETTVNYTNWGDTFDISAPPADKITDMPAMPETPSAVQ